MLYAITKDSTGSVLAWGGRDPGAPSAGETAHAMVDADSTDQDVIDTATPRYTKVVALRFVAMDQTEKDAVDAAENPLKMYKYIAPEDRLTMWPDHSKPPMGLDYGTGLNQRLEKKVTLLNGQVIAIGYYATATIEADGTRTYDDLIVEETHTYVRDLAGFALSRDIDIEWKHEDGSGHAQKKKLKKTYSTTESIREGKRQRSNVIDGLEIQVAGMLIATEVVDPMDTVEVQAALDLGRAFLEAHQDDITAFVEGSVRTLHDTSVPAYNALSIQAPAQPWMDNVVSGSTIRAIVLATLDIWS